MLKIQSGLLSKIFYTRFTVKSYYSIDLVQQTILSSNKTSHNLEDKLFTNRHRKYQAVIFDKDGTLICFHSMWTPWIMSLVKNINMELSMDISSSIFSILGVCDKTYKAQPGLMAEGTKDQIKKALEKVICAEASITKPEAQAIIDKHFKDNASNSKTLKDLHNIGKLFKVIRQHGMKIGICTSDTREGTLASLTALDVQHLVDHICCGDDPECKPKPDPHNSKILADKLVVPASEMVMVGDTKTDMEFGRNSEMSGIIGVLSGVGDSDHLRESGAKEIIQSVEDILPFLIPESPISLSKETETIRRKNWKLIIMDKDGTLTDVYSKQMKWVLLLGDRLKTYTNEDIMDKFYKIVGFEKTHTFTNESLLLETSVLKTQSVLRYLLILEGYSTADTEAIMNKVWVETSVFGEDEISHFRPTLLDLKSRGIKLALNSSDYKSSIINFIKRNNIDDLFDVVLSAEDSSPHFKPLPNSIQKICSELQISEEETMVIGDSQSDMLCAKSAKVGARVGVLSGIGKPQSLMKLCHVLLPNINYVTHLLNVQHTSTGINTKRAFSTTTAKYNRQRRTTDYVIVGAGSAGCVLANRLSKDAANSVTVLEAGPKDNTWTIDMPAALMYNLCHDKYNWFYTTLPQRHMNNRSMYWPRGRVLGGSSSLNAMAYVRGHAFDYNRWEKEGAAGWNYNSCLPYFKKAQTHELGEDTYRGGSGLLHVSRGKTNHPLHAAWIKAGVQAGYCYTDDMNGYKQEGFGMMDMTIHKGARWSASKAYLRPAMNRPNLTVDTNVLVTRVLFNGKKAVGVEIVNNKTKEIEQIMAEKEVILSGGSINSPQLLMLSGVGPAGNLKQHNIELVQDVAGVGQNLQDHLEIYIQYECKQPITLYKAQWKFPHNMIRIGLQWFLTKTGWGATSHLESGGFIRSEAAVEHPDIQYHFLPSTVNDHGRKMGPCHAYQAHAGPMRSGSRGYLELQSNDPRQHPIIDPNYQSLDRDFSEFRKAIRLTREIFSQQAFDEFRGSRELLPGDSVQSDKELDEYIRNWADSAYHPSCTCRMGSSTNNTTVVDEQCRVVGVDNLRVVDASIMPSIVSGNLNAPTIMLAEKAADIIQGVPSLQMPNVPPVWSPTKPQLQRETDDDYRKTFPNSV